MAEPAATAKPKRTRRKKADTVSEELVATPSEAEATPPPATDAADIGEVQQPASNDSAVNAEDA